MISAPVGHPVSLNSLRAAGTPEEVVTSERVEQIYDLPNVVIPDPVTGGPLVVPRGRSLPAPQGTTG